jgi:putative spermidine/putrescine transport system ATP-binding protein
VSEQTLQDGAAALLKAVDRAPTLQTPTNLRDPRVAVRLTGVSKSFGAVEAVKNVNLELRVGALTSLLGPSGCGKTTLLRLIAGLEAVTSGEIEIGARDVSRLAIHKRNIGFVFQNYALFPHKTVGDNVAFGLKHHGVSAKAALEKVRRVLEVVRLTGMEDRYPNQLSGGQQQRVALARAVAFEPAVLLLDEPLSALDANLREEMRVEIKLVQKALGLTTVLVTHDQQEALAMSDEVVVMSQGQVQQTGDPRTIYRFPRNRFVATFLGQANCFRGQMEGPVADRPGEWRVRLDGGTRLNGIGGGLADLAGTYAIGDAVDVVIRGSDVTVAPVSAHAKAAANTLVGRIDDASYLGDHAHYLISASGLKFRAVSRIAGSDPDLSDPVVPTGTEVRISVPVESCAILPAS